MAEKNTKGSWMGKPSDPLTGFSWKTGSDRHTSGIVFWSDVFLYDSPNGEKYAIYLIDTQGLFDTKTPLQENVKIFGLGTLISSLQIFNLENLIQEDQLQYLQMATDYARFAVAENKGKGIKGIKAFQNLLLLMRDWNNVEEYGYGLDEGHRYLIDILQVDETQKPALQEVRRYIQASFEKVYCFLMPHPGQKVVNNKKYDGRYSEMDVEFRDELNSLITWLFNPKNFKAKKIFNVELTAKKLYNYMHSYFDVFQMDAPEVESIYEATVNSHLRGIVDTYLTAYQSELSKNVDVSSADSIANLEKNSDTIKSDVMNKFRDERKMGSPQQEDKYSKILGSKIDEFFQDFKVHMIENHNLYMETLARAEQEKTLFEEELNSIIHANRSQMAEEIKQLEEEFRNKELEIANMKEHLESAKEELMRKIADDHTMTLEEIEISKNVVQQSYQLKMREIEIEEQNRIGIYQQTLVEKQNEMALREQAIFEQEHLLEEKLKKQEEFQMKQLEREQAFKMEQLRFEQEMEGQRFEREKQMHEREMQQELQKHQFEREMEAIRNANREKMLQYQFKLEEMKERSLGERRVFELEQSKQQQAMQLEVMRLQSEKEKIAQQAQIAREEREQGFFSQILQTGMQLAPMIAAGSQVG